MRELDQRDRFGARRIAGDSPVRAPGKQTRVQAFGLADQRAPRGRLGHYQARELEPDPASGLKLRVMATAASIVPSVVGHIGRQQMQLDEFAATEIPAERLSRPAFESPLVEQGLAPDHGAVAGDQPDTAHGLHQAYLAGTTTPTEVALRFLAHQKASDHGSTPLRAFIEIHEADVLAQAAASTERYQQGHPLSELDGIPIAVKGQLDLAGYVTTGGASIAGKPAASQDAAVVAKLRARGALIVGATNMHELGYGVRGENPQFGAALNAYDRGRVAGGSSGGSASAVAAGLVPMSIGSDAGGSIRIPAAHNGVVGLKPTYGLLDQTGNMALAPSLQSAGPIANTAADAATLLQAMAGPGRVDLSRVGDTKDLSDVTIGIVPDWNAHADPQIVAATSKAIAALAARGARIRVVEIRGLNLAGTAQMTTYSTEVSELASHEHGLAPSPEVKTKLAAASGITAADVTQAQRARGFLAAEMKRVLAEVDLVITPATGVVAPAHDPKADATGSLNLAELDATARFATLANLTGLPAVSFPAGYDHDGMPIGVQAIGRAYGDGTILRIAAAAGEVTERKRPDQSSSLLR